MDDLIPVDFPMALKGAMNGWWCVCKCQTAGGTAQALAEKRSFCSGSGRVQLLGLEGDGEPASLAWALPGLLAGLLGSKKLTVCPRPRAETTL